MLRRQLSIAALRVFFSKALQALKEAPDDCENTAVNTTNFRRFQVHLFKLFSPQLNGQTDSHSLINTLLIHFLNQNLSQDTFHEQKNTDSEKFKKEVINVFTPTEFDNSPESEYLQIIPS